MRHMKPIRLPVAASNVEDAVTKGVGASPKSFLDMFNGGRHRKSSISESSGCLALLDAGEQRERPRAFPTAGEILPTFVKAQPTVHVHRPRAVLSSPENDELACEPQGQEGVNATSTSSAPKAVLSASEDLPHAALSSIEDLSPLLSSKVVLRTVPSAPESLLSMGARETAASDAASSCSTSSNRQHIDESNEMRNELVDVKKSMSLSTAATNEKKINRVASTEIQYEGNGNQENLSSMTSINRMVKKHSNVPSNASCGPAKQQLRKPAPKGKSGRVLRPWY